MSKRLAPYGQKDYAGTVAAVGNIKGANRSVGDELVAGSDADARRPRRLVRLNVG
jgi:hypothetical protein